MSAIDFIVFEGKKVEGLPRFTLSRGELMFADGKLKTDAPRGKFVKRQPHAPDSRAMETFKRTFAAKGVAR